MQKYAFRMQLHPGMAGVKGLCLRKALLCACGIPFAQKAQTAHKKAMHMVAHIKVFFKNLQIRQRYRKIVDLHMVV